MIKFDKHGMVIHVNKKLFMVLASIMAILLMILLLIVVYYSYIPLRPGVAVVCAIDYFHNFHIIKDTMCG